MTVIISVLCRSRNGIVQIQTEELSFSWETSQSIRSDACGYSKSIMDHTCSTLAGLAIAEQIHSFPVLGVHGRCEEGRCVLCAMDVLEADETRGYFLCLRDIVYLFHRWMIPLTTLVQISSHFNHIFKNCSGISFFQFCDRKLLLSVLVLGNGQCLKPFTLLIQFSNRDKSKDWLFWFFFSFQWLWIKHNVRKKKHKTFCCLLLKCTKGT